VSSGADEPPLDALSNLIADAVARRAYGAGITPWELPAVVACRNAIADALRQLPIVAMRAGRPRPDQPTIYAQPDPDEPRGRTLERIAFQLTGPGYCWLWVTIPPPAGGFAGAARLLDAEQAHVVESDPFGRPTKITDLAGVEHRPGDTIIRIGNHQRTATELGTSPIGQCWRAVQFLCALYDMAGSFGSGISVGRDGRRAPAIEGASRRIETTPTRRVGAPARPAVIDNGATLESVGSSAVESQLVESIAVANAEIARAYGSRQPRQHRVGRIPHLRDDRRRKARVDRRRIGRIPVRGSRKRFSALGPHGTDARLATEEWARGDPGARAAFYASALAGAAWMTTDEVRDREHLDPIGADVLAGASAPPAPSSTPPSSSEPSSPEPSSTS
jgi:hypothetical protein